MRILLFLILMISCSKKQDKQVIIYKQWHLSPDVSTLDINKSLKLPQAKNQIDIYNDIVRFFKKHQTNREINFLSEGCQGNVEKAFSQKYNGWNLEKLKKVKDNSVYPQIMAPIGMKLLAKYKDKINVYCSDNQKLVKKHLLVFSDIKGLLNYYLKFKSLSKDSKDYKTYLNSFKTITNKKEIRNPTSFVKNRLLSKIEEFEKLLYERNDSFIKLAKKLDGDTFIVIGGLHTLNLKERLKKLNISTLLKTPKGYSDQDDMLIQSLKEIIKSDKKIIFNSVPSKFEITKFPKSNLISDNKLMSLEEKKSILKSLGDNKKLFSYLLSDFDKDGIRDFTLSTSKDFIVISSEDSDWDNDGVENLVDTTVGNIKLAQVEKNRFESLLQSETESNIKKIRKFFKRENINLVALNDTPHILEVLSLFELIFNQVDKARYNIKNIVAKKPKYTYGKQVFFSYVKASSSLEYYPDELKKYLNMKRSKQFVGASAKSMFNGFTSALIIHSISHELIHSRSFSELIDLRANNWSFDEIPVNSIYLSAYRLKQKVISHSKAKVKYLNKSYKDWLFEHKTYIKTLNSLLKKGERFGELIKTTPWYTFTKSTQKEYQSSFLSYNKIVSIYSTHSPDEWVAENLAMCLFQKIYKLKPSNTVSAKYEVLLGINPFGVDSKLCKKIKL